jgi:hypothetical protein
MSQSGPLFVALLWARAQVVVATSRPSRAARAAGKQKSKKKEQKPQNQRKKDKTPKQKKRFLLQNLKLPLLFFSGIVIF